VILCLIVRIIPAKNGSTNNVNNTSNGIKSSKQINIFIVIDVGKFFIDVYNSLNNEYYLKIKNNKETIKNY
jgi:hypothetical protein